MSSVRINITVVQCSAVQCLNNARPDVMKLFVRAGGEERRGGAGERAEAGGFSPTSSPLLLTATERRSRSPPASRCSAGAS